MHRFRPTYEMKAYPIDAYPAKCQQAAAIMHMVMNNLDYAVAQVSLLCNLFVEIVLFSFPFVSVCCGLSFLTSWSLMVAMDRPLAIGPSTC